MPLGTKLKQPVGNVVDKIVSGYHIVYGRQLDEDIILTKCRNAISCIQKVDKEIVSGVSSGQQNGAAYAEEVQGQNAILRDCIEQLTTIESSRASLVSYLRGALQVQELKLEQIHNQLQSARSQSEQAGNICGQFLDRNNVQLQEQSSKEIHTSLAPHSFIPGNKEQSAPDHTEEDPHKSAAAAVAAKLTASTSSAQMLSFVLSSLASEGVIRDSMTESSSDYPLAKRPKVGDNQSAYVPVQTSQLPVHPVLPQEPQHNTTTTAQQASLEELPPLPSSSPPALPPPPMAAFAMPQLLQTAGSISSLPYSYNMFQQQPPPLTSYHKGGAVIGVSPFTTPNSYHSFHGSEDNFYTQSSSVPQ